MLLSNLLQALLVKYASALLSVLVITLTTPFSAIAFTMPVLMGGHVESMDWMLWVALAVLMVGIVVYRIEDLGCQGKVAKCKTMKAKRTDSLQASLLEKTTQFDAATISTMSNSSFTTGFVSIRVLPCFIFAFRSLVEWLLTYSLPQENSIFLNSTGKTTRSRSRTSGSQCADKYQYRQHDRLHGKQVYTTHNAQSSWWYHYEWVHGE